MLGLVAVVVVVVVVVAAAAVVVVLNYTKIASGPVVGRVEIVQDVVVTPLHEIGGIRLTMHCRPCLKV